jgi:hypothetical protein
MPGRHTAHRRKSPSRPRRRLTVTAVLAVLFGASSFGGGTLLAGAVDCSEVLEVSVAAAPESVALLEAAARDLEDGEAQVDGACVTFQVSSTPPGEVGQALMARTGEAPDLWVPDSSTWVQRVSRASVEPRVVSRSLGRSPVVLAGRGLSRPRSWQSALSRKDVRLLDPRQSSASTAALLALRAEKGAGGSSQASDAVTVALAQRLGGTGPRDVVHLVREPGGGAAVLSEQQLIDLQARGLGGKLDAAVPRTGTMVLDYPLLALADDSTVDAAGEALADHLGGAAGADLLHDAGFRTGDLEPLPDRGVGKVRSLPSASADVVVGLLGRWTLLSVPNRILGVFDVSASMDERVGRLSREELAAQTASGSLDQFPDQSRIGVWAFSQGLGEGGRDYRELAPVKRLDARTNGRSHRDAVRRGLQQLPRLTHGGTGLHDTVLAAVRAAQEGYESKAMNAVVLLTDGRNDDPGSISIGRLVRTLEREYDPMRPVLVVAIGIGPDVDAGSLRRIAAATGGHSFVARDPAALGRVFQEALLTR